MSSTETTATQDWVKQLECPEIQDSLTYLIQKLPDIQKSVQSADELITFGQSFLKDQETIQSFENRLKAYPLNAKTLEAAITLVGKLPMLLQLVETLEQITLFVQNVLGDEQSIDQLMQSFNELPLVEKGKETVGLLEEIKERAESEPQQQVSIFALMKWMKDPTVQKGLHYARAALDVLDQK